MGEEEASNDPVEFTPLSADNAERPIEMESLCVECGENGTTTMLMTSIPHFREVILMAFCCPHCGHRNNEIRFAGAFGDRGVKFTLNVEEGALNVLSRQLVKSDSCVLSIPELDFEIPANTQKGQLSTVEGFLRKSATDLLAGQEIRKRMEPDVAKKIDDFCEKLVQCAEAKMAFTIVLDDPSGNSFIEAEGVIPKDDPILKVEKYVRTVQQSKDLGLAVVEENREEPEISPDDPHHGKNARGIVKNIEGGMNSLMDKYGSPEEVMVLPGKCSACGGAANTKMFATTIPYFKEVIIMSTQCDICGFKSSDVRPGGGISDKGKLVSLKVQDSSDLRRDVIKSETSSLNVPELDLEIESGSLGSIITTVEGILQKVKTELMRMLTFQMGDAADEVSKTAVDTFSKKLDAYSNLEAPWTLILKDPLANSFIAPAHEGSATDDRLTIEEYERSAEEDELFGIADMKANEGVGETIE